MSNRKIVEETAMTIENTKKKSIHLRKNRNNNNNDNDNKIDNKKNDKIDSNASQNRINVVIPFIKSADKNKNKNKTNKLKKKKKDLSQITCYNCDKKKHFKNACSASKKKEKEQNR